LALRHKPGLILLTLRAWTRSKRDLPNRAVFRSNLEEALKRVPRGA
jgi:hypothetical protein